MLVEINNDNPIWREPPKRKEFWIVRTSEDDEPEGYPVDVINVNGDVIGTANSKDEYMALWNADADNMLRGTLLGDRPPFVFLLVEDPFTALSALLTETGEEFISENSEPFNLE